MTRGARPTVAQRSRFMLRRRVVSDRPPRALVSTRYRKSPYDHCVTTMPVADSLF